MTERQARAVTRSFNADSPALKIITTDRKWGRRVKDSRE
jgi:hypothetical protein